MDQNLNRLTLCGQVAEAPQLSHCSHTQRFYRFTLSVPRLSGQVDLLPVLAAEPLLQQADLSPGCTVTVTGQLRSFNNRSGEGPRLVLSTFARTLTPGGESCNCIQFSGVLCKPPSYRRTPLGREICDLILAVNRRYGRADYLPAITWGAIAQQTAALSVGDRFTAEGRLQSRVYRKKLPEGELTRTAYEISVMRPAELWEFTD
ncbi:MAG: single-stranded DNA-binding protein [Ruminococcaceae bacterium]|nr:single-stranded DNA-binding protein [Oscillospiraceae bacterium]